VAVVDVYQVIVHVGTDAITPDSPADVSAETPAAGLGDPANPARCHVEAGVFLNMLGYGGVLPFEIIYLHNGRGFSLGVAGLVVGTITGIAVVASPAAGQLIDRFGARLTPRPGREAGPGREQG